MGEVLTFNEAPSETIVGDGFTEDTGFQTNKKLTLSLSLSLALSPSLSLSLALILTPTLTLTQVSK